LKNFSSVGPQELKRYEDIFHDLTVALQEEGFFSNLIEDNKDLIEEQAQEEVVITPSNSLGL
jgi:hypothetical protein